MAVFSNCSLASERELIEAKSQLFNVQIEQWSNETDRSRLAPRQAVYMSRKRKNVRDAHWSDVNTKDNSRTACHKRCTLKLRKRDEKKERRENLQLVTVCTSRWTREKIEIEKHFSEVNRNTKRESMNNSVKKVNYIEQGELKKYDDITKPSTKCQIVICLRRQLQITG